MAISAPPGMPAIDSITPIRNTTAETKHCNLIGRNEYPSLTSRNCSLTMAFYHEE